MFSGRIRIIATSGLMALGLSACAAVQGFPDNPTTVADDMWALKTYFNPQEILDYSGLPVNSAQRLAKRNEIVYGRMAAYDLAFAKFQQDINAERTLSDTTGDLTVLTLTALGATIGPASTKTALSAWATAVNGGRLAIDKNVFYDKTLPVLFAQMEANRLTIRAVIEAGMVKSDTVYPLTKGLADLMLYRDAGSIPGAISGVATTAGQKKGDAEQALFQLRGVPITPRRF